nr:peptidoglycan-binding protein [Xanthomonas axonopodis]
MGYSGSDGHGLQANQTFDASTKQAVEAFQRANGLTPVDVKAGPAALAAIDRQARGLQSDLIELGFTGADSKPLRVDGYLGSGTRQAVSAFQEANGLPVTGVADRGTLDNLVRQTAEHVQANDPAQAPPTQRGHTRTGTVERRPHRAAMRRSPGRQTLLHCFRARVTVIIPSFTRCWRRYMQLNRNVAFAQACTVSALSAYSQWKGSAAD